MFSVRVGSVAGFQLSDDFVKGGPRHSERRGRAADVAAVLTERFFHRLEFEFPHEGIKWNRGLLSLSRVVVTLRSQQAEDATTDVVLIRRLGRRSAA